MLIDIHTHVTPTITVKRPDGSTYCTPKQLLAKLDEAGIDMAVLLPMISPEWGTRRVGPEEVLDIVAEYPDRFIPFCNIDPRMVSNAADADLGYLMDYYRERGCPGEGEVCANLAFDDPLVQERLRGLGGLESFGGAVG